MTPPVRLPTVVLFDVDGTLIDSGGAGARSWTHAFDKLYGISADIGSHTAAGETDPVRTSEGYRVLEGVEDLLPMLSDAGTMLGLVSGAMEGAARVKLSRADLNRFFVFGGYGSDSDDRAKLTRGAIGKAAMLHGRDVTPDRVFVVGDTPLDVEAARAVGAVSVAVASGKFSVEELRWAGARHVLPSLAARFPEMSER